MTSPGPILPGDEAFYIITNRQIYEQLVKLRQSIETFAGLREALDIHTATVGELDARIVKLEEHAARLWFVRPVSVAAMAAVLGDIATRYFHLLP